MYFLFYILNFFRLFGKRDHHRRIKTSRRVLKRVRDLFSESGSVSRTLSYLRKCDPFVFEEIVLSRLQEEKISILRNRRYTGDGGTDGVFFISGKKCFLQCKRYSGYVSKSDLFEFSGFVRSQKGFLGFFVHTGKTPDVNIFDNVFIVCDDLLILWILEKISFFEMMEQLNQSRELSFQVF